MRMVDSTLDHRAVPPLKNSRLHPHPSVVGVVRWLRSLENGLTIRMSSSFDCGIMRSSTSGPCIASNKIFEAHSHHPIKATHEKSCACYPMGPCHRFPRPPSPAKEQNQADSKTR
ncbi:hypothetical protein TNCV_362421 [Trichonephila clavipes]|nr:hypothetical protein TNCV_362421 [Trichonephila clavipes]